MRIACGCTHHLSRGIYHYRAPTTRCHDVNPQVVLGPLYLYSARPPPPPRRHATTKSLSYRTRMSPPQPQVPTATTTSTSMVPPVANAHLYPRARDRAGRAVLGLVSSALMRSVSRDPVRTSSIRGEPAVSFVLMF